MPTTNYTFQFSVDASDAEASARQFAALIERELANLATVAPLTGLDNQIAAAREQIRSLAADLERLNKTPTAAPATASAAPAAGMKQAAAGAREAADASRQLAERLEQIRRIDTSAGIDGLRKAARAAEEEIRRLDDSLRRAELTGQGMSQHTAQWAAQLEEYYSKVANEFGQERANTARARGVVASIGQVQAEFINDTLPPEQYETNAYAELKQRDRQAAEELQGSAEKMARLYELQIAAARNNQAIIEAEANELIQHTANAGPAEQAQIGAALEHLDAAGKQANAEELQAIQFWTETQHQIAAMAESQQAKSRQAQIQAGNLAAAAPAGAGAVADTSRVQITVSKASADNAEILTQRLQEAKAALQDMIESQDRLVAAQKTGNDQAMEQIRAKSRAEHTARAEAEIAIEQARSTTEAIKSTTAEINKQAKAQTVANTQARAAVESAKAGTEGARAARISIEQEERRKTATTAAEVAERKALARSEEAAAVAGARIAAARIQEEERRTTARLREEIRDRAAAQRAASPTMGGMFSGLTPGRLGAMAAGALGVYGADQIARQAYQGGKTGASQLQLADSYDHLAKQAGIAGDSMIEAIQKASRQTIPEMAAIGFANQVLAQKFARGSENIVSETEIMIRAARRFSQIYPDEAGNFQSVEEIFGRLVKFVREGNKELVDQFQISNQAIADSLGIPNEGLRGAEGATLRWQGLVKILTGELDRLGEATGSTAEKIAASEASITDSMDRIRQSLAVPTANVAGFVANQLEDLGNTWIGISDLFKDTSIDNQIDLMNSRIEQLQAKMQPDNLFNMPFLPEIEIGDKWRAVLEGQIASLEQIKDLTTQIAQVQNAATAAGMSDELRQANQYAQDLHDLMQQGIAGPLGDEQINKLREINGFWDVIGSAIVGAQSEAARLAMEIDGAAAAAWNLADALASARVQALSEEFSGRAAVPQFGPSYAGGNVANPIPSTTETSATNFDRAIQDLRQASRESLDQNKEIYRARQEEIKLAERTTQESGRAWQQTARETLAAFDRAIGQIPGLFGSSGGATEDQMARAAAGLSNDFADNYIRRLKDEIENKVDWPDVSIEQAAGAVGLDPGIDPQIILKELQAQWQSGELFNNPDNLGLVDFDAARADYERQQRADAGKDALREATAAALGVDIKTLEDQANTPIGRAAAGLAKTIDATKPQIKKAGETAAEGIDEAGATVADSLSTLAANLAGIGFTVPGPPVMGPEPDPSAEEAATAHRVFLPIAQSQIPEYTPDQEAEMARNYEATLAKLRAMEIPPAPYELLPDEQPAPGPAPAPVPAPAPEPPTRTPTPTPTPEPARTPAPPIRDTILAEQPAPQPAPAPEPPTRAPTRTPTPTPTPEPARTPAPPIRDTAPEPTPAPAQQVQPQPAPIPAPVLAEPPTPAPSSQPVVTMTSATGQIDPSKPVRVIIHGWNDNAQADWVQGMSAALIDAAPADNVIAADYSALAAKDYPTAAAGAGAVSAEIAAYLQEIKADPARTQLIGHSLGGQIAGNAGSIYAEQTGQQLGQITALDPAGPSFADRPPERRLDPTDAAFVDVYHTSSSAGDFNEIGSVDLYPNRGAMFQPGSKSPAGNHAYSAQLYTDTIRGNPYTVAGTDFGYGMDRTTRGSFETQNTSWIDTLSGILGMVSGATPASLIAPQPAPEAAQPARPAIAPDYNYWSQYAAPAPAQPATDSPAAVGPPDPSGAVFPTDFFVMTSGEIDQALGDAPADVADRFTERMNNQLETVVIVDPVEKAWSADIDANIEKIDPLTDRILDRFNHRIEEGLGRVSGNLIGIIVANVLESLAGEGD